MRDNVTGNDKIIAGSDAGVRPSSDHYRGSPTKDPPIGESMYNRFLNDQRQQFNDVNHNSSNKFPNEDTKEQCNDFYDTDDSDDFFDDEPPELIDGSCPYYSSDDDSDYEDNKIKSFDFSESSHINNSSDDDSDRSDDGDKKISSKFSRVLSSNRSLIPKRLSHVNNSSDDDSDTSDHGDKKLPTKLSRILSSNHVNNSFDDDSDTSDDGDKNLPAKLSQGLSAKRSTIPKQLREITVPISPSSSQNSSCTNHCSRNCASSSNVQRVLPNRQYF